MIQISICKVCVEPIQRQDAAPWEHVEGERDHECVTDEAIVTDTSKFITHAIINGKVVCGAQLPDGDSIEENEKRHTACVVTCRDCHCKVVDMTPEEMAKFFFREKE